VALTDVSSDFTCGHQRRAAERAFALRQLALVQEGCESPLKRVAALFAVLSRNNAYEGRDPAVIAESLRCGVLADYLSMTVDELSRVLVDMQRCGVIEPGPDGGVRINSFAGLESLADA
jgi:CRP/FNR family transcriptional regulator, anaerobic regulatory protein